MAIFGALLISMSVFPPVGQEEYWEKRNYGRLEIQVVDEDTFQPVKEKFSLQFYTDEDMRYGESKRSDNFLYTDDKGYFSGYMKPGEYYLYASPESESTKYCIIPNPIYFPETQTYVKVEKGKTAIINKVAYRAGQIKIILVNKNGSQIYPIDDFDNFHAEDKIENVYSQNSPDVYRFSIGDLSEGEMIKPMLYPGKYNLELYFSGMGYGSQRVENILVEKNKTTRVNVVIDLESNTGVEGRVIDQFNSPVKGVEVEAVQEQEDVKSGFRQITKVYTDSNGYYKIIGLASERFKINFSMQSLNKSIEKDYENVYIDKGMLTRLDKSVELKAE